MHTHTTASDGKQSPSDNVRLAAEAGLAAVAITDHDTVAGVSEALDAGFRYGIVVVPGVEISTADNGTDIHILGYGISWRDPVLLGRLEELRAVRGQRNERILARLNELGMPIAMEEVAAEAQTSPRGDGSIGRPHIADVLVRRGFAANMKDAFDRYLGEGGAAHIVPPRIAPEEAIRWIHEAGGVAVVAHPGLYRNDELVERLLEVGGADGIEAFHSDHDEAAEQRYSRMAAKAGKLVTGGSDFHGTRQGVVFHGPIGSRTVDASIVSRLLREHQKG